MLVSHFQTSQDICCVVFALFNVVWATLFLERWKRREAELAYRWGTLDTPAESLEEPRPQFRVSRRRGHIIDKRQLMGHSIFIFLKNKLSLFRFSATY